jgi:hypothetical protein
MGTRTTRLSSDVSTLPLRGGLPVRAIQGRCIRVCSLAAILILMLGCDVVDTSTARPANAETDTIVWQASVPSITPVPPTPTELPADVYLARAVDQYDQHVFDSAITNHTRAGAPAQPG